MPAVERNAAAAWTATSGYALRAVNALTSRRLDAWLDTIHSRQALRVGIVAATGVAVSAVALVAVTHGDRPVTGSPIDRNAVGQVARGVGVQALPNRLAVPSASAQPTVDAPTGTPGFAGGGSLPGDGGGAPNPSAGGSQPGAGGGTVAAGPTSGPKAAPTPTPSASRPTPAQLPTASPTAALSPTPTSVATSSPPPAATPSPTNSPPVANDDAYSATLGVLLVVPADNGVLANDADPNGEPLSAVLDAPPSTGTLSLAHDGSFTFLAAAGSSGTVTFTYHATDGSGNSNVATVSIRVGTL